MKNRASIVPFHDNERNLDEEVDEGTRHVSTIQLYTYTAASPVKTKLILSILKGTSGLPSPVKTKRSR